MDHRRAARRFRDGGIAVVVSLAAVVGAGLLGTGVASAAPPDADAVIEVMPGAAGAKAVEITDDAVYFITHTANPASPESRAVETLYRRSLTATAGGHSLGAPEQLGRVVPDSSFAVHEGTVAYVRAVDGRLVLRAPDGTETVPAWGGGPKMASGVSDLSTEWIVVNDTPFDAVHTLVDRQTGATYGLADLVPAPAGYTLVAESQVIDVNDTRAVWGRFGGTPSGDRWFYGVYTVALGADGPMGAPTVLQQVENPPGIPVGDRVDPVGLDGSRVIWEEFDAEGYDATSILHWSDTPYSSTSSADVGRGSALGHDGSTVVFDTLLGDTTSQLHWIDLSAWPSPASLVVEIRYFPRSVHGTFVSFRDNADEVQLADAAGGTLTGDQTVPPPPVPFTDTHGADPFTDEILWLFDRGVVGGYADGTFRGLAPVNRDALAAFLYRAAHDGAAPPACTTAPFADVPVTHPFCGHIAWLATTGVATGWPDGTFRPGTPVTREAIAAFLYRLAHDGAAAPACVTSPFVDVGTGHPFCGEIAWLFEAQIARGWDATFRPGLSIERQAMAAFLFRAIDGGAVPVLAPAAAGAPEG